MKAAGKFKMYYSYTMIGVYFLSGLFLILHGWYLISGLQNYAIGGMLIVYAVFRLYREIQFHKIEQESELIEKE